MSYLVLARKYRPQTFAEVLEQGHITRTLGNALAAGRVAHAIVFAGPRGTGKTTVARILAKSLNCSAGPASAPCNECRSCREVTAGNSVDVYEIDGASNNSVDQVRELRENVKYMPAHSPYKIYIIDEVHMLSTPAFNALLKTLEEPPAHVLFMFATTEPQRIPITILSRCQRFDFRRVRLASIAGHLAHICRQEGVTVGSESLDLIARESGGSVRDSLSLLDQVIACGERDIGPEHVLETLGVIDRSRLQDLSEAVLNADVPRFLEALDSIYDRGHDIKKLYADLLEHFRDLWVVHTSKAPDRLLDLPAHDIEMLRAQASKVSKADLQHVLDTLYREEPAVRLSPQPRLALEMAFFRILHTRPVLSVDGLIAKLDVLRREILDPGGGQRPPEGGSRPERHRPQDEAPATKGRRQPAPPQDKGAPATRRGLDASGDPAADLEAGWQRITEAIAQSHPSLAANLRKCCLRRASPQQVEIIAPANQFTSSVLKKDRHLSLLRAACREVFGAETEVVVSSGGGCASSPNERRDRRQAMVKETLNHPLIADAIEIFNGKLLDVQILPEEEK